MHCISDKFVEGVGMNLMRFINNLYMYIDITSNMCRDEIDEICK